MWRLWIVTRALCEFARYDVIRWCRITDIQRQVGHAFVRRSTAPEVAQAISAAVAVAACWYWKPVLCLQRSISLARLLRQYGFAATVVIGYRPDPFMSHAWVEVEGLLLPDAQAYRQRLHILYTI